MNRLRSIEQPWVADLLNAGYKLGIDIETTPKPAWRDHPQAGLDPYLSDIRTVQVASPDGIARVFDCQHIPLAILEPLLAGKWTAHNAMFEARHFMQAGLTPGRPPYCSLQMARVTTGITRMKNLSLALCCERQLDLTVAKELQTSDWASELTADQIEYAALDAILTLKLAEEYGQLIVNSGQEKAYELHRQCLPIVAAHSNTGVHFDWNGLEVLAEYWRQESILARQAAIEATGRINLKSGRQVGQWLSQVLPAEELTRWPQTSTGQLSSSKEAFEQAPDLPILSSITQYKHLEGNLAKYYRGYLKLRHPVTDRIHPDYRIAMALGGRFTAPGIHNPAKVDGFRRLFTAPDGYQLVVADYNQIEMRLVAYLAKDKALMEAFEHGQDLHRLTASRIAGVPIDSVTRGLSGNKCYK